MSKAYQIKGKNLLLLLGLSQEIKVLIIGSVLEKWKNAFTNSEYREEFSRQSFSYNHWGLVLVHSSKLYTDSDSRSQLEDLKKSLHNDGVLLIFRQNDYSLSRIKELARNKSAKSLLYVQKNNRHFQRALDSAGFSIVNEFLPMHGLYELNETIKKRSSLLEIPYHFHPIYKFLHSIGRYHYIHDGYLYMCGTNPIETTGLFKKIKR